MDHHGKSEVDEGFGWIEQARKRLLTRKDRLVKVEYELKAFLEEAAAYGKRLDKDATPIIVDVIHFPQTRPKTYSTMDAANWQMTRSYCASSRLEIASELGVRVTDHLFSDQPVGIDLNIVVAQETRALKNGESSLVWKRGFYGKAANWAAPPPSVEVTNARRRRCLGVFSFVRKLDGYDYYENKKGACIYHSDMWKLSEDGSTDAFVYHSDVVSNLPPIGSWLAADGAQAGRVLYTVLDIVLCCRFIVAFKHSLSDV